MARLNGSRGARLGVEALEVRDVPAVAAAEVAVITGPRFGNESGADFDPTTGVLYNITSDDAATGIRSVLYRIDLNGNRQQIGNGSRIYLDGLAINSRGEAFATDFRITDSLYRVNLATGAVTRVGSLGGNFNADSGLAFAPDGTLYALIEDGRLGTVNTRTGRFTFVAQLRTASGALVPGDLEGLAITADGFGYTVSDNNDDDVFDDVYRINLRNGRATLIGQVQLRNADNELEGLAALGDLVIGVSEPGPDGTGNIVAIIDTQRDAGRQQAAAVKLAEVSQRFGTESGADFDPTTGFLYSVTGDENAADGVRSVLYRIEANGEAVRIGEGSNVYLDGLAINNAGQAFATDFRITDSLYRVDLETGAVTLVGSLGISVNEDSGLAFDRATGILYALAENGRLFRLNTTTGAATLVGVLRSAGGTPFEGDFEGLAITADGFGYTVSDNNDDDPLDTLYRINLSTGVATRVGRILLPENNELEGLAALGNLIVGVSEPDVVDGFGSLFAIIDVSV